jgi:predicted protein tyrosine phosphatase
MELDANQILPGLWLGNDTAALNNNFIRTNNITHIVNITEYVSCPFIDIIYLHIPISDKTIADLSLEPTMFHYIDQSIAFIHNALKQKCNVLVHCRKGHHRSANIILIFMMMHMKIGYTEGVIHITNIRNTALVRPTNINNWIRKYYTSHVSPIA